MARESRVTDDDWRAARLKWESGGRSVQQVADSICVSKALVMKRKAAEGWVLSHNRTTAPENRHSFGISNFTESAVVGETRPGSVTGHQGEIPAATASRAAGTLAATPTAAPFALAFQIAEPPDDLSSLQRRNWIRRECEILAQKMCARHENELRHLQAAFAAEITKGDPKDRGPALRLKALTEATEKRHAMQRAALIEFTKQRMGEFAGMPSGVTIIVHQVEGLSFDGVDNTPAGVEFRNMVRYVIEAARNELREAGFKPQSIENALVKVRANLGNCGAQDAEAVGVR